MAAIDTLFEMLLKKEGSDLHLAQGQPPKLRIHGQIKPIDHPPLSEEKITGYLREICLEDRWARFQETGDLDFAYALGERARFRANYYKHVAGIGAVFRIIPSRILSLEQLGLPTVVREFARMREGLVLVTGPTGSGKSTTLAAIIDHINSNQAKHIVTIEEPIEFVHGHKESVIVQREVGTDVHSFADGLRLCAHSDVDIILVGEMRDLETISLAVSAAERGILVFGTLHTNCAAKTIDRIIDVFPVKQKDAIRAMLAVSLKGVCSQLLCKRPAENPGRCAAVEILLATNALSTVIREGTTNKIGNIIQAGKSSGMISMDDSIANLLEAGTIERREAYMKSFDKNRFRSDQGQGREAKDAQDQVK